MNACRKKLSLFLIVLTLLISTAPAPLTFASNADSTCDWLMFGKNPDGNRIVQSGCGLSSIKITKLWETRFRKDNLANVVVWKSNLYLSDNGNIYCINIEDKSVKWVHENQDCENYSHVIDSGRIYIWNFQVRKRENHIVCLDAANGKFIWDYLVAADFPTNPLIVYNNKVYVCSNNGGFICLEGATGKALWAYKSEYAPRTPKFSNNNVYLPGIKCLDATTGKIVWESNRETESSYFTIDAGYIYAKTKNSSAQYQISCINSNTGELVWETTWQDVTQPEIINSLSITNGKLFMLRSNNEFLKNPNGIICFDLTNKKVLWEIDTGRHKLSPLTFDNGYIITGSDQGQLLFIDQNTGKIVKTYDIGQPVGYEIVIASKKLFVTTRKAIVCYENEQN